MTYLTRRRHRVRLVRDLLRSEILEGRYVEASLPTEEELSHRFHTGRNVARLALSALVEERLIKRVQGRGTNSTAHVLLHSLNSLRGVAEDGKANIDGNTVTYKLLTWDVVTPPTTVAEQLDVPHGTPVLFWERLTVGVEPMVLWTSYLRNDQGLMRPPEKTKSLRGGTFAYFESFGLEIDVAHVRTGAAPVDAGVAELLDMPEGDPAVVQHRRTILTDGTPIEAAIGYYRSDLIFLTNDFRRPL